MGCTSSDAGAAGTPGSKMGGSKEQIVVRYFDIGHGRASGIKLLLAHSGANWTFDGVNPAEWPTIKGSGKTGEFKGLPFVKQGNRTLDLNVPTIRCLAMEHGYYPASDWKKAATADMLAETWSDIFSKWGAALIDDKLSDQEKAKVLIDSLDEGAIGGKLFKQIELAINKFGGKFITGNTLCHADFCLASLFYDYFYNESSPFMSAMKPLLEEKHPAMVVYAKALLAELGDLITKRPNKPF